MTTGRRYTWARMFGAGLVLWLLTVAVTFLTANPTLVPTLVLLGSFLVPASFIAWAFEHRLTAEITATLLLKIFVLGGVLGVLAASLLESYLLRPSVGLFASVGLIEEAVKLLALAALTRELRVKAPRDGMLLGACVGFGFSAFESAGYAMMAALTEQGLSLVDLVATELLRGLVAPFGHGLWTAILGGVLFSRSGRESFLLTVPLVLSYLGVSLLHALWDSAHSVAVLITVVLSSPNGWSPETAPGWISDPTPGQVWLLTAITWVWLAVVAAIGVAWLSAVIVHYWRSRGTPKSGYPISTRGRWWPQRWSGEPG
ncbi:PrsW family intramembrane metalloprotease [Saccharopolyspora rhizosphaerae]|uniref:PrsW family intramembrane metalloprotease n=1 Tax=Saccharopolyspora rhizosphaerae TaxID=2492662 RepID=A0A426JN85_9PSEU|nr:PrsW family glutamic-type intramembrane protease [Saccharopolyspora rhizosphaerae]RRO14688.1 PrsW family intramembrane metalloprotease [Saccharopolyspora rhizosphaerae]